MTQSGARFVIFLPLAEEPVAPAPQTASTGVTA